MLVWQALTRYDLSVLLRVVCHFVILSWSGGDGRGRGKGMPRLRGVLGVHCFFMSS